MKVKMEKNMIPLTLLLFVLLLSGCLNTTEDKTSIIVTADKTQAGPDETVRIFIEIYNSNNSYLTPYIGAIYDEDVFYHSELKRGEFGPEKVSFSRIEPKGRKTVYVDFKVKSRYYISSRDYGQKTIEILLYGSKTAARILVNNNIVITVAEGG